ncbi:TPA: lipase family protein [Vibrio parahaemolyticus]
MAELSDFAYQKFEVSQDYFEKFAEEAKKAVGADEKQAIDKVISHYKEDLSPIIYPNKSHYGISDFKSSLKSAGFSYCKTFNREGIQGFVCEYSTIKPEFIAVVFRGTEKNIEDWLTNVNARPVPIEVKNNSTINSEKTSKVHGGFYNGYLRVKTDIEDILAERIKGKDIPVFFTGHSQGGALATIAARELSQDHRYENSACYTFGCPRVADYRYFEFMKTPVYRVVNSSDIVPTMPPGVWAMLLVRLIEMSSHLLSAARVPTTLVEALKEFIGDYQDYRHFGDLRYLTDVNSKQFDRVMLLRNPHMIDSVLWFWRRVAISLGMPARQHSMTIYRKKLEKVAENRLNKKPVPEQFKNFQG